MSCEVFDTAFRDAEQQLSDRIVEKKFKLGANAYWGHIKDLGEFPRHSGTQIKKIRLTRQGYGEMQYGWQTIESNGCLTNICADQPAEKLHHGTSESFFSLERMRVSSIPICLADLVFRQMPEKELNHVEDHLKKATWYFWNEWLRSRFVHTCEKKYLARLPLSAFNPDSETCDMLKDSCNPDITPDGFQFWFRGPSGPTLTNDGTLTIDERYLAVSCPVDQLHTISEITGDFLEEGATDLEYEDDAMPFVDMGLPLYDVIVPDARMAQRLRRLERIQESECSPLVVYPDQKLSLKLGIKTIVRDSFGLRRDAHGMKFYPDHQYNSQLTEPFDATAPATWPRMKRVFAYAPGLNANGTMVYNTNKYYRRAPFGITTIMNSMVMGYRTFPSATSIGSAKVGDDAREYAGTPKWRNEYDKVCNPYREIGNWELHFGAGIEPLQPELGICYFHRLDHTIKLSSVRCPVPILGCIDEDLSPFCYVNALAGEDAYGAVAGGRGANIPNQDNNAKLGYLID
jgi:hypothetical protein